MNSSMYRPMVMIFVMLFPAILYAQSNGADDFFDEFELQDINITSGGTLNILSGGTLKVHDGASFVLNADLTITTDSVSALAVRQADGSVVFNVDTVNADIQAKNAAGTNVFEVDSSATTVKVTTTTNNANGFSVVDSASNTAFAVSTVTDSVSIRKDLTLGTGGSPIIDIGSGGTLFIFPPGGVPHAKTIEIQGDISLSGDLWNPAIFELQSGMSEVQTQLDRKVKTLSSLEKRIDQVNKEIATVKEVAALSPEVVQFAKALSPEVVQFAKALSPEALQFVKTAAEKNVEQKDFERLIAWSKSPERFQESARSLVSDVGMAQLINGSATVELDPRFLDMATINRSIPFFVQLTPADDCNGLFVSGQTLTTFSVSELKEGKSNTPFYWRVEAMKRGFEGESYP